MAVNIFVGPWRGVESAGVGGVVLGRGLHSSTFQLNLSCSATKCTLEAP